MPTMRQSRMARMSSHLPLGDTKGERRLGVDLSRSSSGSGRPASDIRHVLCTALRKTPAHLGRDAHLPVNVHSHGKTILTGSGWLAPSTCPGTDSGPADDGLPDQLDRLSLCSWRYTFISPGAGSCTGSICVMTFSTGCFSTSTRCTAVEMSCASTSDNPAFTSR